LIVNGLETGIVKSFDIIPKSQSTFLGMVLDKKIRILDSYRFLDASLDTLTDNLKNKETDPEKLKNIFPYLYQEVKVAAHLPLLTQKLPFPYDFLTNESVLDPSVGFPDIKFFHNKLKNQKCSTKDYELAERIYKEMNCQSFFDFLKLYQKVDVLLLCDIIMQFRKTAMEQHGLDPLYFFSAPGYSIQSALKSCKYPLEFLQSEKMLKFIASGVRGGNAYVAKRKCTANNPTLASYDATKPCSFIQYYDISAMYSFLMKQYLPNQGFKWVEDTELNQLQSNPSEFLKNMSMTSKVGYLIEVDLQVPEEIHDKTDCFPLGPEKRKVKYSMLSKYQKEIAEKNKLNLRVSLDQDRLLITLLEKKNYVLHSSVLKYYLEHGLVLKKVHRALKFEQVPFLGDFVEENIQRRKEATNSFLRLYYKTLNNSCFGKKIFLKIINIFILLSNGSKNIFFYIYR
jgi:hypothetical protein